MLFVAFNFRLLKFGGCFRLTTFFVELYLFLSLLLCVCNGNVRAFALTFHCVLLPPFVRRCCSHLLFVDVLWFSLLLAIVGPLQSIWPEDLLFRGCALLPFVAASDPSIRFWADACGIPSSSFLVCLNRPSSLICVHRFLISNYAVLNISL